jgi:hypothetical protein
MKPVPIALRVRRAANHKILFLPHAIRQMARPERMITAAEVRRAVVAGEMIEDYPEDVRGHSCLMLGVGAGGRAVHVVCSPKDLYLAVITAYLPEPHQWDTEFKVRKQPS